jgi:hypothetical protein
VQERRDRSERTERFLDDPPPGGFVDELDRDDVVLAAA